MEEVLIKPILASADIEFLISDRYISDFFDGVLKLGVDPKTTFNLLKNDVMKFLNDSSLPMKEFPISELHFAELVVLTFMGKINNRTKDIVFKELIKSDISPFDVMESMNLYLIEDESKIKEFVLNAMANNEASVKDFRDGKEKALKQLIGFVMKETKGSINIDKLNTVMLKELNNF